MRQFLNVSVKFLDDVFHGRANAGAPEWPPSPLRVFQALLAGAATNWPQRVQLTDEQHPLRWLESLPAPEIVAPSATASEQRYRLYVPNNAGDLVAAGLKRGNFQSSIAEHRTEKDVRPTRLSGDALHYLYPLPPEGCPHLEVLKAAARSVTHLGWGVDMVAADADTLSETEAAALPGHRWQAVSAGGTPLRVPMAGTLANLMDKHAAFLGRLSEGGFKPVPPLSCFKVVGYASPTARGGPPARPRPVAAFEIHRTIADQEKTAGSKFRPYHPVRGFATVADMVRSATARVYQRIGRTDLIETFVMGHGDGPGGQATSDQRLMYLPVPSITPAGVDGIRRVLVVGPPNREAEVNRLRQLLNGEELCEVESRGADAMLSFLPVADNSLTRFLQPATVWTTVTPVMLPGYDDRHGDRRRLQERDPARAPGLAEKETALRRLDVRARELLTQAFLDAGVSEQVLREAVVEYRQVGYLPRLDLSHRYELPHPRFPRFHVRVTFPHPVVGPLAVGAGRYRGLGLFASEESGGGRSATG